MTWWSNILRIRGWLFLLVAIALSHACFGSPTILLTNVPAFGSSNDLSGIAVDAAPAAYRVAVFIYVPSASWWSKPYCDAQLTVMRPDGHGSEPRNGQVVAALLDGESTLKTFVLKGGKPFLRAENSK
jgi:hypothetical protein